MNTYTIDNGSYRTAVHTDACMLDVAERFLNLDVYRVSYDHLRREFKRGRRFVRTHNGYAELGVWG